MSDFTSNYWAMHVAGITILSIVFCIVILLLASKIKVNTTSDNTTGHVWDDNLREMNNPLPRWWTYMFWITIVFGLAYLIMYPGLGSNPGTLGWTSIGQHKIEVDKGNAETAPIYAKFMSMKPEDVAKDAVAMAIGERLFSNNCAQCHASDARGNKGFPNLTDGDWLHGGTPEKIKETITLGRIGNMPPIAAAVGSAEDVKNVAHYVLSLSESGKKVADAARVTLGQEKFAVCAACHGPDGKGMQAIGSANLTDNVWLHGPGNEKTIIDMVNNGRVNVMPAQGGKLTEAQIHVLTSYIWGLSNK